jgi:elongation factor G
MSPIRTQQLRNVALVGHGGSGKTTLAEAMLHVAGAIGRPGRVEDGSTVMDTEPEEHTHHQSLSLGVAPVRWETPAAPDLPEGCHITLLDAPGYADLLGEAAAALRAADLAVFVVSAVEGVEVQTEVLWKMASDLRLPRMVFVNKLDRERASFDRTLSQLRDTFGAGIAPLELPIGEEAGFRGIADLLTDTAWSYQDGASTKGEIPDEMEEQEHRVHDNLVEGIVVADEALLERYLDGDTPSVEELEHTLAVGVAEASVFPVVLGSATAEIGIDRLLDFICEIGPSPAHRPPAEVEAGDTLAEVAADPDGAPLAFVFKTIADPYVGHLSLFRVLSGTIRADDHLRNTRTGADVRLHGLFRIRGRDHEEVRELVAGEIGGVAKLGETATSDTLAPADQPVRVPPIDYPEPVLATAIVAVSQGDDDKLPGALHRLLEEDPSLAVTRSDETHQTVLHGIGETHLTVSIDRLLRKFGVHVTTEDVRVPYRETITTEAQAEGRHKKQTGGKGQFGVATVRIEPLPRGEGFTFVDKIVGGAIPKQLIPAVGKGIHEAMAQGGLHGFPVVDVQATVLDGRYHNVDSDEHSFRMAGRLAFREALAEAGPVVLEPISRVVVTIPGAYLGDVMGDLNARRGRVQGTETGGAGQQTIVALVPTSEISRYAIDLRSMTSGRGRFTPAHERYDALPEHLVSRVEEAQVGSLAG